MQPRVPGGRLDVLLLHVNGRIIAMKPRVQGSLHAQRKVPHPLRVQNLYERRISLVVQHLHYGVEDRRNHHKNT